MSAQRATVTPITKGRGAPEWLSPDQVAAIAPGLTKDRLQYLRDNGRGPRYYKPTERTVVYERRDVDDWITRSVVKTRDAS